MKAIVTGGAGFIGSNMVDLLIREGCEVAVIDDLSSGKKKNVNPNAAFYEMDIAAPGVRGVFEKERPNYVFHFAAQISVADSVRNPLHDARVNIIGSLNLLEACVASGVGKFIFSSSGGTVYGEVPEAPASEDTVFAPFAPYGITKMSLEFYLNFYLNQHGLKYTALRYGNVFGPRQDPHGEAGVVAIFARAMLEGKTPMINGDGSCERDYVYVEDVARANFACVSKGDNTAYNVGTGVTTDVNQIYAAIADAVGFTQQANRGPHRAGDLQRSVLDISKAEREIGWSPKFTLKTGLETTVAYFREEVAREKGAKK
ncbi:MAG: NAD-dependent epimerase/dehydratase family protein [bacterium]